MLTGKMDADAVGRVMTVIRSAIEVLPVAVRASVVLFALPAVRSTLRSTGIMICSCAVACSAATRASPASLLRPFNTVEWLVSCLAGAAAAVAAVYPLVVLTEIGPMVGRLFDLARGAQHAEQVLPGIEQRVSHLESFALLLVVAAAAHTDLPHELVQFLLSVPTGVPTAVPIAVPAEAPTEQRAMCVTGAAVVAALSGAWPFIVPAVLFEVGLGFIGRLVPRVQLAPELGALKPLGFLAVTLLGLSVFSPPSSISVSAAWTSALGCRATAERRP